MHYSMLSKIVIDVPAPTTTVSWRSGALLPACGVPELGYLR